MRFPTFSVSVTGCPSSRACKTRSDHLNGFHDAPRPTSPLADHGGRRTRTTTSPSPRIPWASGSSSSTVRRAKSWVTDGKMSNARTARTTGMDTARGPPPLLPGHPPAIQSNWGLSGARGIGSYAPVLPSLVITSQRYSSTTSPISTPPSTSSNNTWTRRPVTGMSANVPARPGCSTTWPGTTWQSKAGYMGTRHVRDRVRGDEPRPHARAQPSRSHLRQICPPASRRSRGGTPGRSGRSPPAVRERSGSVGGGKSRQPSTAQTS